LLVHALLPAGLYFLSVLWIVHVRSMRRGLGAVPRADVPDLRAELAARGHMVIPVVVLVGLLAMRHGVMSSAFWAVVSAILASTLRPDTRMAGKRFYEALHEAMAAMGPLVAICAGAGIVIGVLAATGLSLKIAYLIEQVAAGSLFVTLVLTMIACIVLGMGLPTVAAYVVLATLVPASLINLGVPAVAAHLFIFYFAILSAITPPVCTGAYVAAGIARARTDRVPAAVRVRVRARAAHDRQPRSDRSARCDVRPRHRLLGLRTRRMVATPSRPGPTHTSARCRRHADLAGPLGERGRPRCWSGGLRFSDGCGAEGPACLRARNCAFCRVQGRRGFQPQRAQRARSTAERDFLVSAGQQRPGACLRRYEPRRVIVRRRSPATRRALSDCESVQ
jgi:hypothetical protein